MTFRTIKHSTTADASDCNDQFYHIAQGSVLPMQGTSLASTTGTLNLGSSSYKWNIGYFDSVTSTIIDSNGITFDHVVTTTLNDTASSIEISGLNSDNDKEYLLHYFIVNRTSTANEIKLSGNLVGNAFTGYFAYSSLSSALTNISDDLLYTQEVPTTTALTSWGIIHIIAISDHIKTCIGYGMTDIYETTIGRTYFLGKYLVTATVQTLTSLYILCTTGSLEPGTSISLFRKGV